MILELNSEARSVQVQQCQRLAHVLGMTQNMLQLADAGQWDEVATMELERRDDLLACFDDAQPVGDSELVAQAMAALLHLNEEVMAKLRVARTAVMAQSQDFARNRAAATSYAAVDSSS